jgi:hypothetical protein
MAKSFGALGHDVQTELVFYPSTIKNSLILLALIALLAFLLGYVDLDPESPDFSSNQNWLWGSSAFVGVCCIILFLTILARVPRITLNRHGISIGGLLNSKTWQWTEVGPFSSDSFEVKGTTTHFACAFSDRNHDLFVAHGRPRTPTAMDADISIILSGLPPGKNHQTSREFADTLNQMRVAFGAPEVGTTSFGTAKEMQRAERKVKRKRLMVFVALYAIVTIAIGYTIFRYIGHQ